jgi:putative SOS response-associated peptidase YedK
MKRERMSPAYTTRWDQLAEVGLMCGRFALKAPPAELIKRFGLDECADLKPRLQHPARDRDRGHPPVAGGQAGASLLGWGLVPHWAKDPSIGNKLNNARGESLAEKPSFRDAFKRRRCLIPADGFYEWKTQGKVKQPYYISLKSGEPLAMAGLWESWKAPDGSILRTCCVITTGRMR